MSRFRDTKLYDNVRLYLSFLSDKPDTLCINGKTKTNILLSIQKKGLPTDPTILNNIFIRFHESFNFSPSTGHRKTWLPMHLISTPNSCTLLLTNALRTFNHPANYCPVFSLSLYYQNVRGLRSKTSSVYMNSLPFDIYALTETNLCAGIHDCELFPSEYNVFRACLPTFPGCTKLVY